MVVDNVLALNGVNIVVECRVIGILIDSMDEDVVTDTEKICGYSSVLIQDDTPSSVSPSP